MASWFFKRNACRLCDSAELDCVVPLGAIPILTPNVDAKLASEQHAGIQASTVPLALYRCAGCGHVQLLDVIDPRVQYNNFRYTTTISLGLPEHFRKFAGEVIDASATPAGGFVVEVGSNDGTLLRAFQERGMKVLGIDPAQKIAQRATESGVKTLATFFTEKLAHEIRSEHGAADIVIANNTFANLDDLTDFAAAVRGLLAPSGVFVFETSYGKDVVQKTLIDTIYHEHLSYFMAAPLDPYFSRHGLQLIDLQHIWTKGGSIRGTVQLKGGARKRSAAVAAMVEEEKRAGFADKAPFRKMNAAVIALQKEVSALVSARKAAGKRVAAYGASVGTVTLLQQFRIGPALDFVADDHPLCDHVAGADYRLPVLRPEAIYERKPDTIIVLAWRYAEPIIGKHQRFLAQGGEFVIPLPAVTVRSAVQSAS
jgi:SAM-dependent methyltransferase